MWRGKGIVAGIELEGQIVSLRKSRDELLITADRAKKGYTIENTGDENIVLYKYFGPDINVDNIPWIKQYK